MKFGKKQILSALLLLGFGAAVFLSGFYGGTFGGMGAGNLENASHLEKNEDTIKQQGSSSADTVENGDVLGATKLNFEQLEGQNPDIYAWITIPGTKIDYPVLQKGDAKDPYDNFYLDHQVDLTEGLPGVIYSQPVNGRDFMDSVTVLYGHNMKNGEMFSGLHFFADKDFFAQNRQVIIETPEKTFTYEIFAAVDFSDELLPYAYDFTKSIEVRRHLADVRKCEGNFREEIEISEGDKILVLSTCYSDRAERRLLVEAVLTEEQNQ